jgi:membrane protein implicated in regulation of membrane protease activity
MWILWLILAVGLMVAEIFTLGFFLFWFGVGALAAAVVGFLGLGLGWQFLTFAVVSIALTAMSRTIFARYLPHADASVTRTGVDSFPGKIGTVTESSQGALNQGAVRLLGTIWTAYPLAGEGPLAEGDKVEVVEVRGSSIYVRPVRDELPEWRETSQD